MQPNKIIFFVLCLVAVVMLAVSCGQGETSTVDTTTRSLDTTAPISETTTSAEIHAKKPPVLLYKEQTVPDQGYISLTSDSYISGTLLDIRDGHPYEYNLPSLIPSSQIKDSISQIVGQNLIKLYGHKSQNYLLKGSKLFLKTDAFDYWESMVSDFVKDSGKTSLQVVNAYLYSDPSTLTNDYVTGYCLAVNLLEEGITYSLTAPEHSFSYQDKTVTCLEWFILNCHEYGFVYTGLSGTSQQTLATFRFVGIPHAVFMQQNDIIDVHIYTAVIKNSPNPTTVTDNKTKDQWTILYQPKNYETEHTIVELPAGAIYSVSGDNLGGFVIAYKKP